MKKIYFLVLLAFLQFSITSCVKDVTGTGSFDSILTPRTNSIPHELVGRWAIMLHLSLANIYHSGRITTVEL